MHGEQRIPSADVLPDVHLVQVDLCAAQALIVLETHATLPHHDDNIPTKDIGALREKGGERESEREGVYLHANCVNFALCGVITWATYK